jgi:hypothetical protein
MKIKRILDTSWYHETFFENARQPSVNLDVIIDELKAYNDGDIDY